MGRECSTHGREGFWWKSKKNGDHKEDLGVGGLERGPLSFVRTIEEILE
jgi:hypothetical protein